MLGLWQGSGFKTEKTAGQATGMIRVVESKDDPDGSISADLE